MIIKLIKNYFEINHDLLESFGEGIDLNFCLIYRLSNH
jgi:hypothetical protein